MISEPHRLVAYVLDPAVEDGRLAQHCGHVPGIVEVEGRRLAIVAGGAQLAQVVGDLRGRRFGRARVVQLVEICLNLLVAMSISPGCGEKR